MCKLEGQILLIYLTKNIVYYLLKKLHKTINITFHKSQILFYFAVFEMLKTLLCVQVELLREAIAGHERDCQYRLVNCVDLACQQRCNVTLSFHNSMNQ